MTPLGGEGAVRLPVPAQPRLPQARARGDDGPVPCRAGSAFVEHRQVRRIQYQCAVGGGLQIVEKTDAVEAEELGETLPIHDPAQVGSLHPALSHGTRNAEAGHLDDRRMLFQELRQDRFESWIASAGKISLCQEIETSARGLEDGQARGGAADVSRQNHPSRGLHSRPS